MLLFMDGMAHYGTAQIPVKYTAVTTAGGVIWSVVPEGRYGNCIKRTHSGGDINPGWLTISPFVTRTGVWALQTSGVCGFAFKVNDLQRIAGYSVKSGESDLFVVMEGASKHISVALQADGTFALRGRESTFIGQEVLLAQSAEGIQSNSWAYLEFKWVIHETEGRFTMRVNSIPIIDFTGNTLQQYTLPSPMFFGVWTSVHLCGLYANNITAWMCDLYLADLAGGASDVKDFLGDGTIVTIFPDGVGLESEWTPSAAVPNWDLVNDKPVPDGDATYVTTVTPGVRDCHTFEDIPAGSLVLGAHYNMLVRKEDEGTALIKPIVGQGGVQYDGPTQGVATIAYDRYLTQPYDLNPATGLPWTAAEINAGQWGILKEA